MKRIKVTGIMIILILSIIPQLCQADDWDITAVELFNFDTEPVDETVLVKIDDTHFLCVYSTNTYWMPPTVHAVAVVLTVDTVTGMITRDNDPFIFDYEWGLNPDVSIIDNSHYLCTYTGLGGIGKSVVLTVDLDTWVIITETFFVFETDQACYPVLSKIDDSIPGIEFYLCDYSYWNTEGAGKSVILTVDTSAWYIDMLTCFEFESSPITAPTLSKIDENHFLCAYVYVTPYWDYFGRAVVLTVDSDTWTINQETPFDFEENNTMQPALSKIDENHYLCAYVYETPTWEMFGRAVVLTVDTDTWTINQETPFDYGMEIESPSLSKIDDEHYLSAFALGSWEPVGASIVLNIDNDTWEISQVSDLIFDPTTMRGSSPYLSQIDDENYLCTYNTPLGGWEGWSVILNVELGAIPMGSIEGQVLELAGMYPIPIIGAEIYNGTELLATSNDTGDYTFEIEAGTYMLTCIAEGYEDLTEEVEVIAGEITPQSFIMTPLTGADNNIIPSGTVLHGNYPNPFNPTTTIAFSLKEDSQVILEVYNVKGESIKQLVSDQLSAGKHSVVWNGTDNSGKSVSSGVYFYKLSSKNFSAIRKMILMK